MRKRKRAQSSPEPGSRSSNALSSRIFNLLESAVRRAQFFAARTARGHLAVRASPGRGKTFVSRLIRRTTGGSAAGFCFRAIMRAVFGGSIFFRADEGAGEFAFDVRGDGVGVDAGGGEELARVVDAVNACMLDFDLREARGGEFGAIFGFLESAGDAANPQFDAAADFGGNFATSIVTHYHV